jgi:Cu-Zn family superoxide dismutase
MAAQTFLFAPPAALFAAPSSSARPFHSLRLVAGPGGAAAARALVLADATKKAVAVLKGTSEVEGVVTLTQEDDGASPIPLPCHFLLSSTFRLLQA